MINQHVLCFNYSQAPGDFIKIVEDFDTMYPEKGKLKKRMGTLQSQMPKRIREAQAANNAMVLMAGSKSKIVIFTHALTGIEASKLILNRFALEEAEIEYAESETKKSQDERKRQAKRLREEQMESQDDIVSKMESRVKRLRRFQEEKDEMIERFLSKK